MNFCNNCGYECLQDEEFCCEECAKEYEDEQEREYEEDPNLPSEEQYNK